MTSVSSAPVSSSLSPALSAELDQIMAALKARNPGQDEFHQAAHEVVESVLPLVHENKAYRDANILGRILEPERVISFRVEWEADDGSVRVNRGWRVQFNSAIGPFKGGLRFHPSVTEGTLKFLGFEQIFKNSLTTLPMGGGKGGSDFDPKGKSDREVQRFCRSFMTELFRHIGEDTDVPAGDIGVGAREIGYLYGHYARLTNTWTPVFTGKGREYGGSLLRPEATGYGTVYFVENMLNSAGENVKGKTAVVSGSGNVAQYTVEKLNELGAKTLSLSDSGGTIYDPNGITAEKLAWVMELKNERRGRISEYVAKWGGEFREGANPWSIKADLAFPSATQNELDGDDARALVKNGVKAVGEGANMPCTPDAVHVFQKAGVLFGPAKAANAGGVAVSGLEQAQNSQRLSWTREEVDAKLKGIMASIHTACITHGKMADGKVDYVRGANIAGFIKVANAMLARGIA